MLWCYNYYVSYLEITLFVSFPQICNAYQIYPLLIIWYVHYILRVLANHVAMNFY